MTETIKNNCLSDDDLLTLIYQEMSENEQKTAQVHLDSCEECKKKIDAMGLMRAILQKVPTYDPPDTGIRPILAIAEEAVTKKHPVKNWFTWAMPFAATAATFAIVIGVLITINVDKAAHQETSALDLKQARVTVSRTTEKETLSPHDQDKTEERAKISDALLVKNPLKTIKKAKPHKNLEKPITRSNKKALSNTGGNRFEEFMPPRKSYKTKGKAPAIKSPGQPKTKSKKPVMIMAKKMPPLETDDHIKTQAPTSKHMGYKDEAKQDKADNKKESMLYGLRRLLKKKQWKKAEIKILSLLKKPLSKNDRVTLIVYLGISLIEQGNCAKGLSYIKDRHLRSLSISDKQMAEASRNKCIK